MLTRLLLAICLSLSFVSCKQDDFADKPAGWNCTYFYDAKNSPAQIIKKLKSAQTIDEVESLINALDQLGPDTTGFYCNGIKQPDSSRSFNVADPEINKARCMPLETAQRYDDYLVKKYKELKNKCQ